MQTPITMKTAAVVVLGVGLSLGTLPPGNAAPMGPTAGPNTGTPLGDAVGNNPYGIGAGLRVTRRATDAIATAIADSYDFCRAQVDEAYVVDCLGEQMEAIAQAMPKTGEYAEAQKIIREAGTKLRKLARTNVAPRTPRVRATGTVRGRTIVSKPLTPVDTPRIKSVNQQAAAILAEAETKLLRSAEASDRRLIAYAQMAKAVGSNKTLLRSA